MTFCNAWNLSLLLMAVGSTRPLPSPPPLPPWGCLRVPRSRQVWASLSLGRLVIAVDVTLVVLPAFVLRVSAKTYVRKPPPHGSLSGCPMERTRPPAGVGTSGRGGQEQADPQRGGHASSPLRAARPLSVLTDIRSASPFPLLFTFKYLGFHCDIVLLGVCICCFITRGLRSPSPRRLLPLMPELGQRFTGAGCIPTLAFQIIDGPLIITFHKHQVGMPSA